MDENDLEILELIQNKKTIILLNKIDLNLKTTKSEIEKKDETPSYRSFCEGAARIGSILRID